MSPVLSTLPDASRTELGATLKALRLASGLPIARVASELSVSVTTVYAWESGLSEPDLIPGAKLLRMYGAW
jgi:DNA-binding transcriptional regulator YiaG